MRYGCVFDKEYQIVNFLEERTKQYEALLKELDGNVEFGIRIFFEMNQQEETHATHEILNSSTCWRTYLAARKAHYVQVEPLVGLLFVMEYMDVAWAMDWFSLKDLRGIDARDMPNILLDLLGKNDIILIDSAAGLGREALAALEASDELLLIANPELTSVADALKASKLAEQVGTKVSGLVLNKVSGKYEMKREEITGMLDNVEILSEIPEDLEVKKGIFKRVPVIYNSPNSKASKEIKRLAANLIGEVSVKEPWHKRLFSLFR